MAKAFQEAQEKWCEGLLSQEALCDAVAILGPEQHRKPFIRALLANLSEPLRCALYGEFKEGITQEVCLEQVSVDAFDVMLRSSCGLDPKLTPKRAIEAVQVAKMYLIEQLETYCMHYLRSLQDCNLILETMTQAAKQSYLLPDNVQLGYWATILYKCLEGVAIVDCPAFLKAHGSVIAVMVKLNELQVDEERLWTSLLTWSANAVEDPELLGPFAAVPVPSSKRIKLEHGKGELGVNGALQQQAILSQLAKDVRFATMRKEFFADQVRAHLSLEDLEPATLFFLTNRVAPDLVTSKRSLPGSCLHPIDLVILSRMRRQVHRSPHALKNLQDAPWVPDSVHGSHVHVLLKDCVGPAKLRLCFDCSGRRRSWQFALKLDDDAISDSTFPRQRTTQETLMINLPAGCKHFTIFPNYQCQSLTAVFSTKEPLAALTRIQVLSVLGAAQRAMEVQRSLANSQSADEA